MSITPSSVSVDKAGEFTLEVTHKAPVDIKGADAQLKFKKDVVEIVKIEAGPDWAEATGADADTFESAIEDANNTGELQAAFFFADGTTVPAGESTVMTLTMKGKQDGKSAIELLNVSFTDGEGNSLPGSSANGEAVVGNGGGGGSNMLLIILGIVAAIVVIGGGAGAYVVRRRKTWA